MSAARRLALFLCLVLITIIVTVVIAPRPLAQDPRYHDFADTRRFLGIPNFANVVSNVVFVLAGLIGLRSLPRIAPIVTFCIGAILTGAGSAIYHWRPSDATLVFDRLGMVVAMAAFITLLMIHFDIRGGRAALPFMLVAGIATVLWWRYAGDLRPYAVFQAIPVVLVVLGSAIFPRTYTRHSMLWLVTIWYVVSKACESLDREIYAFGNVVSGHTLKHLIAGLSLWMIVRWLQLREMQPTRPPQESMRSPATTGPRTTS